MAETDPLYTFCITVFYFPSEFPFFFEYAAFLKKVGSCMYIYTTWGIINEPLMILSWINQSTLVLCYIE